MRNQKQKFTDNQTRFTQYRQKNASADKLIASNYCYNETLVASAIISVSTKAFYLILRFFYYHFANTPPLPFFSHKSLMWLLFVAAELSWQYFARKVRQKSED